MKVEKGCGHRYVRAVAIIDALVREIREGIPTQLKLSGTIKRAPVFPSSH